MWGGGCPPQRHGPAVEGEYAPSDGIASPEISLAPQLCRDDTAAQTRGEPPAQVLSAEGRGPRMGPAARGTPVGLDTCCGVRCAGAPHCQLNEMRIIGVARALCGGGRGSPTDTSQERRAPVQKSARRCPCPRPPLWAPAMFRASPPCMSSRKPTMSLSHELKARHARTLTTHVLDLNDVPSPASTTPLASRHAAPRVCDADVCPPRANS